MREGRYGNEGWMMEDKSVRFESDFEQGGFTAMPNNVLVDAELSVNARFTYCMLRFYAWQGEDCWPGQDLVARQIGCSTRSLRHYIGELEDAGLLRTERRGMGRTNRYILTAHEWKQASGLDRKQASASDRKQASGPIEEDSVEEDTKDRSAQVRDVFDYWREKLIHPNAKLDRSRRTKINARLKDGYTVEDLKKAIDGCAKSAWHMGLNPSNKRFDDIALICRDASKVESFMAEARGAESDWDQLL